MNELRSTEILDKEIQADARKKAEKIVNSSKEQRDAILNSVSERIEQAKKERALKYEEKIAAFEKDEEASIPLEKQRFFVTYAQVSLEKAVNDYIESLSEEELLELVLKPLTKYEDKLKSKKVNAYIYGFETGSVKKMLEKQVTLASLQKTEFNKIVVENSCGIENKRGIILETEDKSIRCRLTLSEVLGRVMNTYREELFDALFNGGSEK